MIISICDDDRRQLDALKTVLREWDRDVKIHGYNSAEQFLFSYPEESCDLLLLDIEMGDMNGIELARKLRNRGDMLPIIFITGYSEFMQQGFDVEALHYLLKPLDRDKLFEVLDRYAKRHTNDARIVIRSGDESVCISTSDIVCLEAFGKKTQIRLSDGSTILSDCGLGAVSEKLGETFISCHRSYIVNLAYIRSISRTDVTLDSGEKVPMSRRSYDSVNRAFISYYAEKGQS